MSATKSYIIGSNDTPVGSSLDGHQTVTTGSFNQFTSPVEKIFPIIPNTPVQLENIPCAFVTIQNHLENDVIRVGGLADQTPYIDRNFPGDSRGRRVYPGTQVDFQVSNANLLQVVGTPMQRFSYDAHPNVPQQIVTSTDGPPELLTVTNTSVADGATQVVNNQDILITFNHPIDPDSLSVQNVQLSPTTPYSLSIDTNDPNTIHITPTVNFTQATTFTITLTKFLADTNGMTFLTPYTFSFTTIDTFVINSVTPLNTSTNIPTNASIAAIFNRPVDPATITNSNITISPTTTGNAFYDTVNTSRAGFQYTAQYLLTSTTYIVQWHSGIKDLYGNRLDTVIQTSFTTASANPSADVTPPTVTSITPASAATNIAINTNIVIVFSEPIASGTVTNTNFVLKNNANTTIPTTSVLGSDQKTVTVTPTSTLAFNNTHTMQVLVGVTDLVGNALAAQYNSTFTTGSSIAPTVTSTTPTPGATGISVSTNVTIVFSVAMLSSTINTTNIQLLDNNSVAVASTVTLGTDNKTVTLDPNSNLSNSITYTIKATTGVKAAGNNGVNMISQYTSTFTTVAASPPTVTGITPANNATAVSINSTIVITFSQSLQASSIDNTFAEGQNNIQVLDDVGANINFYPNGSTETGTNSNTTVTIDSINSLKYATKYTVKVSGVKNNAGVSMVGTNTYVFTTQARSYTQIFNHADDGNSAKIGYDGGSGGGIAIQWGAYLPTPPESALQSHVPRKWIWKLQKVGSPTGTIYMRVVTDAKNYGVAGQIGATVAQLDVSTISTTATNYTFEGPNNNLALDANSWNGLVLEYSGGNSSNYIKIYRDDSGGYDSTKTQTFYWQGGTWNYSQRDIAGTGYE